MTEVKRIQLTWENQRILQFVGMLLYKLATELGYSLFLQGRDALYYPVLDLNLLKYLNGWIWCIVLYLVIRHGREKTSSFMLMLLYISQVIPITAVYALLNKSALYYNLTCLAILFCELFIAAVNVKSGMNTVKNVWGNIVFKVLVFVIVVFLVSLFLKNGLPTLIALNIYKVYELRRSNLFQIGKYGNYLLNYLTYIILPFLIAERIDKRKYRDAFLFCIVVFIIYLYTGHKSFLFSIPLVIFCSIWMKRKGAYRSIFTIFSFGFVLLVLLAFMVPFFESVYELIGRRVFIVSAINKFTYYDFFMENPKMGLAGIFPRWLINIENPYGDGVIGKIIAGAAYNLPDMNANTGFLAEGFMRFGYIGIFIGMAFYTVLLQLLDYFQDKTGYPLAVSAFVYPMLMLTDSHLIDSVFFGNWMIGILLILLYREKKKDREIHDKPALDVKRKKAIFRFKKIRIR